MNYAKYGRTWKSEEINFIKENFMSMTDKEIAIKLKRTIASVSVKRCILGIHRAPKLSYNKSIVKLGINEANKIIEERKKILRMKDLICLLSLDIRTSQRIRLEEELKKLSGLNSRHNKFKLQYPKL